MADFSKMSVEELEAYRIDVSAQIDELKASFHAAGEAKSAAILASPKGAALAKLSEARAELAAATAGVDAEELDNG